MEKEQKFLFLNLENRWPLLKLHGLEINQDGSIALARVPEVETEEEIALTPPDPFIVPAGIAVDEYGNIYLSDTVGHRIFKYDVCTKRTEPIPCLEGDGNTIEIFNTPRGLWISSNELLYVADSGNNRILLFDLHTLQVRGVLGQPEIFIDTHPDDETGRLREPWDIAGDSAGNVYVVDWGNKRVQKFNKHGIVIEEFWETIQSQVTMQAPNFITVAQVDENELIFVVDRAPSNDADMIFVFDLKGHWKDDWYWPVQVPYKTSKVESAGIVVTGDAVYIGDNIQENTRKKSVLKFRIDGTFVGRARGYEGPVAALGLSKEGNLLVHPGEPMQFIKLLTGKAFLSKGSFLAGPYNPEDIPVQWHSLQVQADQLPQETQLQLFAYTSNDHSQPSYNPAEDNPFEFEAWQGIPRNVMDALIPSPPKIRIDRLSRQFAEANAPLPRVSAKYLWLGGLYLGNEKASPVVHQIRVDYEQETYLRFLPPVYADNDKSREFLERFLALFGSILGDVEESINDLAKLFDPYATPARFLPWLANWLALDLDEDWSESELRDAISHAFTLQSLRGTVKGMQRYLKFYRNVDAVIKEPILYASLWCLPNRTPGAEKKEVKPECWALCPPSLPQNIETEGSGDFRKYLEIWQHTEGSILGYSTMLAPAHAQGAVVGTTSTLDQSHLIEEKDFGAPLFEDLAHFFYVQVHWNQLRCKSDLDKVRALIEREKPAHTDYHLCVIEPKMRVGFQSQVGIDTIVADEAPDMVLTAPTKLGHDTVISEFSGIYRQEGRVGQDSRIGTKTSII